jgi:hypothetical protein
LLLIASTRSRGFLGANFLAAVEFRNELMHLKSSASEGTTVYTGELKGLDAPRGYLDKAPEQDFLEPCGISAAPGIVIWSSSLARTLEVACTRMQQNTGKLGVGGRGGRGFQDKVRERKLGCRGACSSFEGFPQPILGKGQSGTSAARALAHHGGTG